ncbi:hypothetical protein Tco_0284293, partial [Tanacetum coccineum]
DELRDEALCKVHWEIEDELRDDANVADPYRVVVSVESVMFEKWGRSNGAQKLKPPPMNLDVVVVGKGNALITSCILGVLMNP